MQKLENEMPITFVNQQFVLTAAMHLMQFWPKLLCLVDN